MVRSAYKEAQEAGTVGAVLSRILVSASLTIKEAIKKMNENSPVIALLVVDEKGRLQGTVTDGDIRTGLVRNISLQNKVGSIMNVRPKYLWEAEKKRAREFMKKHRITFVPIVRKDREVVDVVLWQDLDTDDRCIFHPLKDNIVFILAGGKGTRLDPFTKILPKPLIPLGDKPVLEIIIDKFKRHGFNNFILSLNYKGEMIKAYFNDNLAGTTLDYIEEKHFLGTAGSLHMLRDKVTKSFIVSNCDVIIEADFTHALEYHNANGHDATVVGVVRHVKIPYGILKIENGDLMSIMEKPEYDFIVNAGVYVIEPEIVSIIGENEKIDMPDLLLRAKDAGFKIGVYPISNNWMDIGQWDEYRQAVDYFNRSGIFRSQGNEDGREN